MIWIVFLYIMPMVLSIIVCYFDAKRNHYKVKHFLRDCLICILVPLFTIAFLANRLMDHLYAKITIPKINTDCIINFLNKRL
jgi:hypothetical protein